MLGFDSKKVKIPKDLYQKIQKIVDNSPEYDSVQDFVIKILGKELKKISNPPTYTEEEKEKIKERLKNIGYLG